MAYPVQTQTHDDPDRALYMQSPLMVLRLNTLEVLGQYLNTKRLLLTSDGHIRDWRGLEEAAELNGEEIRRLESRTNPTKEIISILCQKQREGKNGKISVQDFFDLLLNRLDRREVVESPRVKGIIDISVP